CETLSTSGEDKKTMATLRTAFACLFFVVGILAPISAPAQSANPQQTLNQYIADLQSRPNDDGLREKAIKLALTFAPKLTLSDELHEAAGRAAYAIKNASSE